ncbi:helix-turn-helix domain-containing protein [Intrasporangium sp.]|uniref:MerR family transcriptional regulator n=1 Tax=Intrasporangium sp. TaxID=1925024 RepID=UPI00322157C5
MSGSRHLVDRAEVWLGVHDASIMLGVSPATLRRWSAAGKVQAFTTPGGHRRYAWSMIQQLLHQPPGGLSLSALGESRERLARTVERHVSTVCRDIAWLQTADEETRCLLALSGRAMVDGLLGYVDAHSPDERDAAIRPAVEAAALHGRVTAAHHGDLGETVAALHHFRGLLVGELSELACRHRLEISQTTRLLARTDDGVDRLVVALVGSHAAVTEAAEAVG